MTYGIAALATGSGGLVGFVLGLIGGGGSILAVPLLMYVVGAGFLDFLWPALANLLSVTKGACYVRMSSSEWPALLRDWQEAGGKWSSTIIWGKKSFAPCRAVASATHFDTAESGYITMTVPMSHERNCRRQVQNAARARNQPTSTGPRSAL